MLPRLRAAILLASIAAAGAATDLRPAFAMSPTGGDGAASKAPVPAAEVAPLVHVPLEEEDLLRKAAPPPADVCQELVEALRCSGFLRVTTPLVPPELQGRALAAASALLDAPPGGGGSGDGCRVGTVEVMEHPSDPKRYAMLSTPADVAAASPVLAEYAHALALARTALLRCVAAGLGLDPDYLARLHSEDNSSLRLLRYPRGTERTGNRCREHSDYGTLTLLLVDGISGLEAFHGGRWVPVPYSAGSLVVNAGSLLERWTGGTIPATLHRVAGPASSGGKGGSRSPREREDLLAAVGRDRTSLAYFCDPDRGAAAELAGGDGDGDGDEGASGTSVAEYIRWRSGGDDADARRSGIAFTREERARIDGNGGWGQGGGKSG